MNKEELMLRAEALHARAEAQSAESVRWALEAIGLLAIGEDSRWRDATTMEELCDLLMELYIPPQEPLDGEDG